MRTVTILSLFLFGLLQACTKDQAPVLSGQSSLESVSLVLYYSDGDFDFKTVGEMALLNTAEIVTVHRNFIRPGPALMTSDWNTKFLPAISAPPTNGFLALKLDRLNGILCDGERCAFVHAICPPLVALQTGAKCHSYPKQ